MKVSEKALKWILNLYPPLLFQRIWVKQFHKDFKGVEVVISNSVFNRNYNGSIFGGTIYAATDPFYAILFDRLMRQHGHFCKVWLKSASISFLKPGLEKLYFTISISDEMIAEAKASLDINGKFVKSFPVNLYDKDGELCATAMNEVYLRSNYRGKD